MSLLPDIKMDLTPLVESIPNGVERIFTYVLVKEFLSRKLLSFLLRQKLEGRLD